MKHLSPAEIETIRVPEPKHDPFSLEALVAWLERQDGGQTYNFCHVEQCLIGRWMKSVDPSSMPTPDKGAEFYTVFGNDRDFSFIEVKVAISMPHTFGAALTRARAALDEQRAGR